MKQMVTMHRLVDFQVHITTGGISPSDLWQLNQDLFPSYEIVRLWLHDVKIIAPFRKILITIRCSDQDLGEQYPPVMNALNICEATKTIRPANLSATIKDRQSLFEILKDCIETIKREIGWYSSELMAKLDKLSQMDFPYVHTLDKLTKVDKRSGIECKTVFILQPRNYQVLVQCFLKGVLTQTVTVLEKKDPLWLEDDFPARKSLIIKNVYNLFDKKGAILHSMVTQKRKAAF
jgi:hypothetical protein